MLRTTFLTLSLALLAGCAGPSYWHEPPAPASTDAEVEVWQGLMRSGALRRYSVAHPISPVVISCANYTDLIRFERQGDELRAMLGRDPLLDLGLDVDADGRFSTLVPVRGDTWVFGGVMQFNEEPVLRLSGRLDPVSGLGEGRINVSPGDERLGCSGRFMVSRNGTPPLKSEYGRPFKIQYWIDEREPHEPRRMFPK
ncbi:hypothetical protein GCM10011352_35110 [Marinobacterium zhoushanense]|uniref:Uncharacterized protein n=1 Tax=Marinobacterium zhoushanense TaxID=1679163 RepID=A0ABQ1KRT3_9GAMM|nr:hypothetical protein [Marinobacterium zhoushanense]GGC05883.1 hypothetical protein GCM10011352_35110 [Marinobacterium zhoushanense]